MSNTHNALKDPTSLSYATIVGVAAALELDQTTLEPLPNRAARIALSHEVTVQTEVETAPIVAPADLSHLRSAELITTASI